MKEKTKKKYVGEKLNYGNVVFYFFFSKSRKTNSEYA